tara:strand:+ start:10433 stop:10669 length:237 start_codon:yes stop_codon:yes gene_type:complete
MKNSKQSPIVSQTFESIKHTFGNGFQHFSQDVQFAIAADRATSGIVNYYAATTGEIPAQEIIDVRTEIRTAIYGDDEN